MSRFIRVVVDVCARNQFFDYRISDDQSVSCYQWVFVPFRKKSVLAFVIGVDIEPAIDGDKCLFINSVVPLPPMPRSWYNLVEFASSYYFYPIGRVILQTVPADFKKNGSSFCLMCYKLTEDGQDFCDNTPPQTSTTAQICHIIGYYNGHCLLPSVAYVTPKISQILKTLLRKKYIESHTHSVGDEFKQPAPLPISWPTIALSSEQKKIFEECISSKEGFSVHLLYGVTGSGKTNTYMQWIKHTLLLNKQVLVLLPEIGLIHQTCQSFVRYFPGISVVCCSSATTGRIKTQDWLAAFTGNASIIIGTRSVLFFPLPYLGLIVVDEEHDPSYKQDDHLRYNARDLAVWYAKSINIPIILSSATPSLETVRHAKAGKYICHKITSRPNNQIMPDISLVDIRGQYLSSGISNGILLAIRNALNKSEQSLVFINRRGFSPILRCLICQWESMCPHCSVRLVFHRESKKLVCHHCSFNQPVVVSCPNCGNIDLSLYGIGTQKVEMVLEEHFPGTKITRVDQDVIRNPQVFNEIVGRIKRREVDIIVGTQMMAKGHDFEHLTTVGIIDADYLLFSPLLRAPERLFSLLLQVAGRSGRGRCSGKVFIQTAYPDSSLYQKLKNHDYWLFADELLKQREECNLPPLCHQVLLCIRDKDESKLWSNIKRCREIALSIKTSSVIIYDPVPMMPFKVSRRYRARLLIESASRSNLHLLISSLRTKLLESLNNNIEWYLNVDPIEV